jgi:pilus assembly protein CpaF
VREQVADAHDLGVCQARAADGSRRVTGVSEVVRVAGGAGLRDVYSLRDGRPCWRAPLGDSLAARIATP